MQKDYPSEFPEKLADTIKAERLRAGLSQEELAKKAGITRQALSLIEARERNPTMYTVYKLILALGVTPVEFIRKIFPDSSG